jgi:hypothetical protein
VVITTALRQWHIFHTLALTYRDAYNRQMNDRYLGKCKEYKREAQWAAQALQATGIGYVASPIPKAAPPELEAAQGNAPGARYFVQVTWCNGQGQEGASSDVAVLDLPDGGALAVKVVDTAQGVAGWNVYAGVTDSETGLQNDSPLAPGQTWVMPETGLRKGKRAGPGQLAEDFLKPERVLQRG